MKELKKKGNMPAIFHITAWHNLGHPVQQKDPATFLSILPFHKNG
jgi:hypothetical protein